FSSRRRHTRSKRDWSSDVCSSDLLLEVGSTAEAEGFVQWLRGILAEAPGPEFLHPLYAVDGSALTSEAVLEHLPGYAGSRPVRRSEERRVGEEGGSEGGAGAGGRA